MKKSLMTLAAAVTVTAANANLTHAWTAMGNVEGKIFGAVDPFFMGNYTINVAGIPAGAFVQKAFLYANEWNGSVMAMATFGGAQLMPASPFNSDNGLDVYKWDVTPHVVLGNSNYSVTITGPLQNNGVCLAIIYQHASLPNGIVELQDGAYNLGDFGPETQSTTFGTNFPGGAGTLSIYTQGDDSVATGEVVRFNGNTVGGPLNGNLGTHASILNMPVSVSPGVNNTASVQTFQDQLGWHVAMLNTVPEPSTIFVLGGLVLVVLGRRLSSQS